MKLGFKLRSVRRSMSRRMREIAAALRVRDKDAWHKALDKPYRGILRITGRLVRQAERASEATRKQMKRMTDEARAAAAVLLEEIGKMVPRAPRSCGRRVRAFGAA